MVIGLSYVWLLNLDEGIFSGVLVVKIQVEELFIVLYFIQK